MSVRLAAAIALMLVLNLAGTFLLKTMTRLWPAQPVLFVVLAAVVGAVALGRVFVWLALGRRFQLSYIHPFLSLNYVLAVFLGVAAFDEPLRPARLVGGAVIAASMVLLSRSPHARERDAGGLM